MTLANSYLNAAPFSLNGQLDPKPSSDSAHYGINFGGPMIIPKLVNYQRASFYITYQGVRSRNPFSKVSTVPSAAERGGDFSSLLASANPTVIFDPTTNAPFANNIIPAMRLNSASLGLIPYFPLATTSAVENYQIVASTPNNNDNLGVRFIAPLNNKDRLNFNVQFQDRYSESEQLFGFRDPTKGTGLSAAAGWSHSFKPRVNNSATFTLSRNNNTTTPYFAYSTDVAEELGITGTSQYPINYGPPNLSFTNFGSLSDSSASVTRNQTGNFTDNLTYVLKQKHNLSIGYLYRRLQLNSTNFSNARGSFSFSGLLTSELNGSGNPISGTGYDFADFLLGLPQTSSLRFGSDDNYFRGWSTAAFANDDYRPARGLTVNFGLRYEYFAPYTEKYGDIANLILTPGFTSATVVTAGESGTGLPSSLVRPERDAFSPRFGIAWRPSQNKSLIFRGGYSIFYSGSPYQTIVSQLASQPPFAKTATLTTSPEDQLTLENGFAASPSETVTNTYAINPDYRIAYAQTWSFAIQNTLPHGLLVELEYIGTKGTNLGVVEEPNEAPPGSSLLSAQEHVSISDASAFLYQTYGGNSIFNAGQIRVTRRFMTGMSAVLLYTYSKSLDDASSFTGTGGSTVQFIDDWNLERGLSTFNQPNSCRPLISSRRQLACMG